METLRIKQIFLSLMVYYRLPPNFITHLTSLTRHQVNGTLVNGGQSPELLIEALIKAI